MTYAVERDLLRQLGDVVGLLGPGPDDRKVAAKDVDDLRELIEVRAAEDTTEGRDARVRSAVHSPTSVGVDGCILRNLRISKLLPLRPVRA